MRRWAAPRLQLGRAAVALDLVRRRGRHARRERTRGLNTRCNTRRRLPGGHWPLWKSLRRELRIVASASARVGECLHRFAHLLECLLSARRVVLIGVCRSDKRWSGQCVLSRATCGVQRAVRGTRAATTTRAARKPGDPCESRVCTDARSCTASLRKALRISVSPAAVGTPSTSYRVGALRICRTSSE
eukprot:5282608-Prymnesium_polylepis.1